MCAVGQDLQDEPAVAEIELEPSADRHRRKDDFRACERLRADQRLRGGEILLLAAAQRLGQVLVPDEGHAVSREGRVPENVIGMKMRVHHVTHRKGGLGLDGGEKPAAGEIGRLRVDDRNTVASDDEAGVGDRARVPRARQRIGRFVDEDSLRDLANR